MDNDIFNIWIFIQNLGNQFEILFNQQFNKNSIILEDKNLLGNKYCFYFAVLLKKLLPEGMIIYTNQYHYIFKYNEHYYDYRGLIPTDETSILLIDEVLELKEHLIPVIDLNQEYSLAQMNGIVDSNRDFIWNQIEPNLLKFGKEYLEKQNNSSSLKKLHIS